MDLLSSGRSAWPGPARRSAIRAARRGWSRATLAVAVCSLVLLAAGGTALARTIVRNPSWQNSTDFGVYLLATRALVAGQDPYAPASFPVTQIGSVSVYDGYVYPPLLAELLVPLLAISDLFARGAWLVMSGASLGTAIVVLSRAFGHTLGWPWIMLMLSATLVSGIVRVDVYNGEANPVLLLLLTSGLWLQTRRRPTLAGITWGVAFIVKPFLAVLVVYLIWKRAWRAAAASVGTSAALFIVSFALTWPRTVATLVGWQRAVAYEASSIFSSRPDNVSLHGLELRLFETNPYTRAWIESSVLGQAVMLLVFVGLVAAFVAAVPRSARSEFGGHRLPADPDVLLTEVGLLFGLSMAVGPILETDHFLLLAPGLAGVISLTVRCRENSAWRLAALAWGLLVIFCAWPVVAAPGVPPLSPDWSTLEGPGILWTGLPGLLLLAASLSLGRALRSTAAPNMRATSSRTEAPARAQAVTIGTGR